MSLNSPVNLSQISQKELSYISDIASCHQLLSKKLNSYSSQCNDAQVKQMLQKASQDASMTAQNLIQSI